MEKEFVPYELALKMKQLGFDEPCFRYYQNGFLMNDNPYLVPKNSHLLNSEKECSTPLYQQAFRWFRENYDLLGIPTHSRYTIISNKWVGQPLYGNYNSYEEAELGCLEKLIEIVEQEKEENEK
jgi:hypothetical protein